MEDAIAAAKAKKAAAYRAWYLKNKARRSEYNCRWDKAHRDRVNARRSKWVGENRAKTRAHSLQWNRKNGPRVAAHQKAYRKRHPDRAKASRVLWERKPQNRLIRNLRKRLHEFLRQKLGSALNIFSTTPQGLRDHIQSQFTEGMRWENYGAWHIDHIRPLSSFDLSDRAEVITASHWSNLRPLWAAENLRKHAKWVRA
jgi:hypothetical protein